ncbi:MAG: hypothetical protein IMF05_14735 [Proteobacteria bacterium]|nr:hypothetical protein [Pseudomonadota bacterium]
MTPTRAYTVPLPDFESDVLGMGQCALTGIKCSVCGQYGSAGPWYPTVDCSNVTDLGEDVAKYVKRLPPRGVWKPMDPDGYKNLAARLMPILRQDQLVLTGTVFGPMVGEAKGRIGDFAWHSSWIPLVRESIFREIQEAGFPLVGAPAQLKFQKDPGELLIQLEVRPTGKLASSYTQCDICGRIEVDVPLIVDGSSFDDSIPIQSVYECSNVAVVSAAFADFIAERKLTDISLTPLDVV